MTWCSSGCTTKLRGRAIKSWENSLASHQWRTGSCISNPPISYATRPNNQTSFFLAWGTADDIADPATQSEAFMLALKQAGFFVRPATTAAAPHFWMADPIDEPRGHVGVGFVAPRIARFLTDRL